MEERFMTPKGQPGDELDASLRPRTLSEYVGQTVIKDNLSIYMEAARKRSEPLDHLLLYGPPGLGKTALSMIIAAEMGAQIRVTSGPAIERPGDLASILTNLNIGDVLFIDEIHRLSRTVEEILYPAMEDGALDIMIGKGPSARAIRLDLPRFTLVGATTRMGMLSSPLRDRFGITFKLEYYAPPDLARIITRSARILDVRIDSDGAMEIARRSRGTPRIANRMLARMRDYATVLGDGVITPDIAKDGLSRLDVDPIGLDRVDREVLHCMMVKFAGKPVGLDTLAAATGEDAGTIEDVYEPYLLQLGFIMRTPRGRVPTPAAYEHMGFARPQQRDERQISIEDMGEDA